MRRRGASDDDDDDDNNVCRRQPFRPLQHLRTSRSPSQPTLKSTPPREVILTPRATPKPVKRARPKRASTKVKSEPPEIDVSRVRPPSPSDDPLLLSGRSPPWRARFTPVFSSSPPNSACPSPPVSFAARLSGALVGAMALSSSPDVGVHALPTFDAPRTVETSEAWSDSDDDEFNLTGEYTGKFKILKVPTKADPPSREHMASWGRPVSPFPFSAIMERSLPLSEAEEEAEGIPDAMMPCDDLEVDVWEVATEPPPSDVEPSFSEDEFADFDDDFALFDMDAESTQVRPLVEPRHGVAESDQSTVEEQEEEALIDRELSVPVDDTHPKPDQPLDPMEGDSSEEEDDVEGEDIIKITSEDPKAAARAAAILRMVGECNHARRAADQNPL
ncbi:hypothetical protein OG21DRAFT_286048 [Imleria badia]|nr:hypothetical protein OG21DRAFT_286048 [Imleria badia]